MIEAVEELGKRVGVSQACQVLGGSAQQPVPGAPAEATARGAGEANH